MSLPALHAAFLRSTAATYGRFGANAQRHAWAAYRWNVTGWWRQRVGLAVGHRLAKEARTPASSLLTGGEKTCLIAAPASSQGLGQELAYVASDQSPARKSRSSPRPSTENERTLLARRPTPL